MKLWKLKHINVLYCGLWGCMLMVSVIGLCFAQGTAAGRTATPEPSTVALISTTGFFGYLVRFARKRFEDFKRCFDIVVSTLGLVLATPVLAFAAVTIKMVSPGPVFFKQKRVGWTGKIFTMFKLRTMKVNAEKHTGPIWAKENDPRLIKFGGIIRKSHIDEIPQLINVLKGEMSIIGPRPERPVFVEKLKKEIPDYIKRLTVKPGITGLAQVWHKYDETIEDVKKKIKYDLLYIKRMCLLVDLRILWRTLVVITRGE